MGEALSAAGRVGPDVLAVDWSGRATGAARHLWLARVRDGVLVELAAGRSREELVAELVAEHDAAPARALVVGFDFAFSLPAWYVRRRGARSARALWDQLDEDGERLIARCPPPFWGRPGRPRPELEAHFRATELSTPAVGGLRPKSVFQIGGAGTVGTGSLRGMPLLARLQNGGFSIWPFDPPGPATVVEIYPRLFTGPVAKRDGAQRRRYLAESRWDLPAALAELAASSEDAFDAAISALAMAEHLGELRQLTPSTDPVTRLEGAVWVPAALRASVPPSTPMARTARPGGRRAGTTRRPGPPPSASSTGTPTSAGPLAGVVVADFSRVLAGPLATMLLGDLGATVVKVERPGVGDDTRQWGPPFAGSESTYFLSVNRNKFSVALDLGVAAERRTARRLAERADVLVENLRPGRLDELDLGYADLARANPGLVYCSISGFGTGAGADLAGYDFVVQAMGGLMSITGPATGPPQKVGVAIVDVVTGLHAVIGILSALHHREATGVGQRVEVNLLSSLLFSLVNQASGYLNAGVVPVAMGNEHPSVVPYETIPARDGLVALAVGNDGQFRSLCEVLGRPEMASDDRFATNAARVEHRGALVQAIGAAFAERDAAEWIDRLRRAGIASSTVNDVAQAFAEAAALGLAPIVRPGHDTAPASVAHPIGFSDSPPSYRRPPPALGADTERVLAWLAGEIEELDPGPGPPGSPVP